MYVFPFVIEYFDIISEYIAAIGDKHLVSEYCAKDMFCGLPLYNHRWHKAREHSFWVPIEEDPMLPDDKPSLTLTNITTLELPTRKRFEFNLEGPDHMTIFIGLMEGAKVIDWSFNDTMIREQWEQPYFIYFSYGKDNKALTFTIDTEVGGTFY